jgi:prepilin peptidase CpaA
MIRTRQIHTGSEVSFIVREIILILVLIPSVIGDCLEYRIRNPIIIFGLLLSLFYQITIAKMNGLHNWLLGCILPILILGILFLVKVLGAGDIKLFSVIGGFCGPRFVLRAIVVSFVIGALLSIIQIIRYRSLMNRLQYLAKFISKSFSEKERKPYYVASRDGRSCVIHFSIAIVMAVFLCLQYEQLGNIF